MPELKSLAKVSVGFVIALVCFFIIAAYPNYFPPNFSRGFLRGREGHFASWYALSFYTHIACAPTVLLVGLPQFSRTIRNKFLVTHRWLGRTYVTLVLGFVVPSGIVMAFHAIGGWLAGAGFLLLSTATWFCTFVAWRRAVQADYTAHAVWMIRSYLLIASAVNLRLLTLAAIEFQLDARWSYVASSYLSWLVPLSLFEMGLLFSNLANRYKKS